MYSLKWESVKRFYDFFRHYQRQIWIVALDKILSWGDLQDHRMAKKVGVFCYVSQLI